MSRVARKVKDKRVLKLIRAYLEAGVFQGGVVTKSEEGVQQGGPMSPLLANIMLDDFNKELTRRGHNFVRYADDGAPRRRNSRRQELSRKVATCCIRDEGRPLGAAIQVEASNHLKLLWTKAMVVSVKEKARQDHVR